jgi:hypothetical protein
LRTDRRVRYPWAIAPTSNTTKLVATAIATFVSMDKFIIFPPNYGGHLDDPLFKVFFPLLIASNFSAQMDARMKSWN